MFGTSLSDPGNAFLLTGTSLSAPDYGFVPDDPSDPFSLLTLIPDNPYAVGGNRFSNGPTWIEQLAKPIGLARNARPAFVASVDGSSNYAVGGSRARDGVAGSVWLSQQVGNFLRDVGPRAPRRALYIIEIGGNDLRDALFSAYPLAVLGDALFHLDQSIRRLHAVGARKFFIWNVPNLGRTPAIRALDELVFPGIAFGAAELTMGYNEQLNAVLGALSTRPPPVGLPGIEIVVFDAFDRLENVLEHPRRYGLRDVETIGTSSGTGSIRRAPGTASSPSRPRER